MTRLTNLFFLALALLFSTSASAQDERVSSSVNLKAAAKSDVTIPFLLSAEGKRFEPTWGLDQAWINEQNLKKGINHMGRENIGIGRTAFRFTRPLVNDSALASDVIQVLRQRATIFNTVSPMLPLVFTADQEAGADEYFVKNKVADLNHWAAMINSHVHWMQQNTQHPIAGISPFNEGDYWTVEEGATAARQWQVAKLLKENHVRCAEIPMVGGNTLNDDKALEWYSSGQQYYDWGNTHQLAGSFDNFAAFYQRLKNDGKVGYADEMHNVGEAMIGLEYGMTVGIWWGFDSRARGEFCQISRHGERLAYGEHRANWTAGSVYRHDDGRVKAFVGSSERQALTTSFQFVSPEREVYYDGYGPVKEYRMEMPGGTGYQKGQTNAERVIDVTWGEDVQPGVINGTYQLVNKLTGGVVAYTSSGANIVQQAYTGAAKQQWTVKPCSARIGGDYSFYDIESVDNAKIRINVKDYSTTTNASVIAWTQNGPTSNEQWYLEYAGDGYYLIRNRESALYLASAGTALTSRVVQLSLQNEGTAGRDRQLWRLLPTDVTYETEAPAAPAGLAAEALQAAVKLAWTPNKEDDLAGYMVLRAPQGSDQWNTIARKVQTPTYVDNTCTPGLSYIYKVKAIDNADNLSAASETALATPSGEKGLLARWRMAGNLTDDTSNAFDAVSLAAPAYVEGHDASSQAVNLQAGTNYVQLPYEVANSDELTITMWVKWTTSTTWQRIFDFGNGTDQYMFLTPNNGSTMRFAIKNGGAEQTVDCKQRLAVNVWKHIAVVIGQGKATIYIDGEQEVSSTGITIKPSDIHPVLNYLGRSQFTADPYFRGLLDDVRIYNCALDQNGVKQTMEDVPSAVALPAAEGQKRPSTVFGLDGRQRQEPRSGLNIIDGRKRIVK